LVITVDWLADRIALERVSRGGGGDNFLLKIIQFNFIIFISH